MSEQSIFERVCDIVREQGGLDDTELTEDTKLADVGLDSLAIVEIVMSCEDEFDIEVDPDTNPATIGEFVDVIEGLVGNK